MYDTQTILSMIDCRDVVARSLGQGKAAGKWVMYPCPLHKESKGRSFGVTQDGWKCFGKCDKTGDAIAFLREHHGLSFADACQELGGYLLPGGQPKPQPRRAQPVPADPPPDEWQVTAWKLVKLAQELLYSDEGQRAYNYLRKARGLWAEIISEHMLGYVPGHFNQWHNVDGLKVPAGILIPWYYGETLWAINVRRAAGDVKYQQVSGGHIRGALFNAGMIVPHWPVLFVEGEFDCLIAEQCAMDITCPVTLGGASNQLHERWFGELVSAPQLLVAADKDEAGDKAAAKLQKLSSRAKRVTVPEGKDITDFYKAAGMPKTRQWIEEQLG